MGFTYDADGWFSGYNEADVAAGRVTTLDPEVVEGGPGLRWSGEGWTAWVPSIVPLRDTARQELQRLEALWVLPRLIRENITALTTTVTDEDRQVIQARVSYLNSLRDIVIGVDTASTELPSIPE